MEQLVYKLRLLFAGLVLCLAAAVTLLSPNFSARLVVEGGMELTGELFFLSNQQAFAEGHRLEYARYALAELEHIAALEAEAKAMAEQEKAARAAKEAAEYQAYIGNLFAGQVILSVPFHGQMPLYPTGCEAASVSMLVSYATGTDISVTDIINAMPYSNSSPYDGFVGDPTTWDGWTIYPEAMLGTVATYAGSSINLTGGSLETLKQYLDAGKPVVTWIGSSYDLHCVIVVGYEAGRIIYHDPYTPAYASMSASDFASRWAGLKYRALSY